MQWIFFLCRNFDTKAILYMTVTALNNSQTKHLKYTFMHLADAFIQSDLPYTLPYSGYTFIVSMCIPWELNPQPLRC